MLDFISRLKSSPEFGPDLVEVRSFPAQPGRYAELRDPLPPALGAALRRGGIERLYLHQAKAMDRVREGENVLVVTPTASGKSLIYIVPTFEQVVERPGARALYLFPYKALEQDQLKAILELGADLGNGRTIRAEIYDGDTPPARRKAIKADPPDILITNPDMLHLGLLAYHDDWRELFAHLRLVVVDELHVYKGIFGTHLHHILARLRRVAEHHGARPRFIASSATIANPAELGNALTGETFSVVDDNGAPRAAKHIAFLNPHSAYTCATKLVARSLKEGYRTIAFTKARKITELIHSWLVQQDPGLRRQISSYRAGYLPEERREIERGLLEGRIRGVISTSALELGVDIGGLDVCVLVGYPGSIVSSWQRIGRVGREDRESLTCLVGMPDALDQYFMREPEEFFRRGFERVVFDPANRVIAADHLVCAAAEIPLARPEDERRYAPEVIEVIGDLERNGDLVRDADAERWYSFRRNPQRGVNLRGIGNTYTIALEPYGSSSSGRVIGTVDAVRAFHECHEGAIYLHHGQQFLVRALDVENRRVRVLAVDSDFYTQVMADKQTEILETLASRTLGAARVHLGRLKVTERILGYEKRRLHGRDRLSTHDLDLPPILFETVGLWMELPEELRSMVVEREGHFMGGIHAVEHAAISLFPLLAICDRNDIGGISYPLHPQIGRSAIFIYDGYPGGVGLAAKGYEALEDLLEHTRALLEHCGCEKGCPSCIQSPKCGNGNQPLDKAAAALVLQVLTGKQALAQPAAPAPEWVPIPRPPSPPAAARSAPQGRILYFDLETMRSADEVGGWEHTHQMGMSVGVVYEEETSQYRIYREKDVERLLLDLVTADRVIGFNIDRFDLRVLGGYVGWDLKKIQTFDMLRYIHDRLGFRLRLDALAEATLGQRKTGDGLQALAWAREGRFDLIEEYCRKDVEVTRSLHRFGASSGYLLYQDREGRRVRLPVDWA
ncbi:MAG TPA: DEAD/DEAH box helicase [Candidatus Polarisedimenticolia bacterium]|nr:DEAD/DEAH box helicase [Candidatus Polarisedimenticolia bacterium]